MHCNALQDVLDTLTHSITSSVDRLRIQVASAPWKKGFGNKSRNIKLSSALSSPPSLSPDASHQCSQTVLSVGLQMILSLIQQSFLLLVLRPGEPWQHVTVRTLAVQLDLPCAGILQDDGHSLTDGVKWQNIKNLKFNFSFTRERNGD